MKTLNLEEKDSKLHNNFLNLIKKVQDNVSWTESYENVQEFLDEDGCVILSIETVFDKDNNETYYIFTSGYDGSAYTYKENPM